MVSFLTDLAKPYVEKLINGVITESSYICCFTCIAKDFEEERASLEIESSTVKQRVDVATRRGEDVQRNVLSWEEEADKLIEDDTKTNQKCFFGFCPHCIWRYRRGKELANKKENMKKLLETGKELAIGLPACLPDVERYSSQHFISFKSRESKYIELLNVLKDDDNYIIGLQGMGGTGKTTLVKEVGKKLKQSKQFTQIIDTTVSFSPDIKRIQDDISGPLGLKLDDCNESDRPKKLWSRLTNGEKILLILDDVWGDIDFNEIGIPYSDNHKGCRILVTTRNLLVCNRLGCSKTIQLDLLCEEDAWIMFQRHAGLSKISSKNLLEKGRKIANECKRLPVAIAAIASSLKAEQRQEEWDVALNSLQKHMSMHGVDDELLKIYKCFQVSYDNMKNEKAKRLFLMCSVFREDKEISTEMLTRFGIGAGLFGEDYGSYEDARSQVVKSKNKLLDSCLLLEANQSRVKMHDLVRDAAQWIANKEIQTVRLYDKNQKAMVERETNIKYLLCEGKLKDVFSFKLDGSKLEILIVIVHKEEDCHNVKIKVLNSFFEKSTGLRVFHLIYDHYSKLALSLPQSIQSLKNIRSLLFAHADLGDISILGNLQSLETLELNYCKIDELPHGITKLEKLKLLNLKYCKIARNNPFEVIEGCSSLEELYFIDSFNGFCREITFPKLPRFHVAEYLSSVDESSSKYVSFTNKDDVFLSETTLKYCMQEAKVLRLSRIEGGWRNIIPEIVPMDQGMNDIVEFQLSDISQLQCLIDTKHIDSQLPSVFSKLVVLNLWNLENLVEFCNGSYSFDFLKSLEKMSIYNCKHLRSLFKCNLNLCNLKMLSVKQCPMLISLFQLSTAVSLVLLERLEINDCGCLEFIIDERKVEESRGEIVDDDNDNTSYGSMFQKLEVLSIEKCPRIELILPLLSAGDLPALETITMKHCDKLEYIFGKDNDNTSYGSMFQKLEVLNIEKCPRIELILPFLSAGDLPALETITMKHCDKLEYIFGKDVKLGSLKKMVLNGIPNFIDIFPECNRTMSLSIKKPSSISGDDSEPQEQSEPIKCNMFSWTDIYCCGKKYGHKLRSTTSTKISLVSEDQLQDNLMESNSYCLSIWERAPQCLSRQPHILCNIKEITLWNISKMKSIFILSIAPRMLLERLTIWNCDELKHIIIDIDDHDNSGNNLCNVFPKLKQLCVYDCVQLEYIIGHYTGDHQNDNEIHLHFPALEGLCLENLPSLVAMCPKQYHTTFPPLKKLELDQCSQVANVKSIGEIMKELSGNVDHFLALEGLVVNNNSKVESIVCLNEINEQQMKLGLVYIFLDALPMMTCLSVGPKNSVSLQNLTELEIKRCEKLKIVFSTSVVRCLPQLRSMRFEECKELKHIIEDDLENKNSSNFMSTKICFPKLKSLVVVKCHKLKYVFRIKKFPELEGLMIREADELEEIFVSEGDDDQKVEIPNLKSLAVEKCNKLKYVFRIKKFPKLQGLMIREADELEEIFVSEGDDDQKVEIPNLTVAIFENLPSLCHAQGIQFQAVKYRFIRNCQKLSLASTITAITADLENDLDGLYSRLVDFELFNYVMALRRQLKEHELTSPKIKMKQTSMTEHEVVENVPGLEIPSIALLPTISEELMNEKSMDQQRLLEETDIVVKPSQEYGDGQIAISSPPISITRPLTTQDVVNNNLQETSNSNDDQVSLNDDAVINVTSIVEEQFSKDVEFKVPEPKLSPIIPSPQEFQTPSMLSKGDPSQNVEDSSSSLLVKSELEQLVSNNHLDSENLSLLTGFLVENPSVRLKDTSLRNRYKGCAYNILGELLKFLETHSVMDVLGSCHSEFVELLLDARNFGFDKDWLDGIERRVLFPEIQVSQDALQKLLDSKQQVTKDVEMLRLKIGILSQHVEDLKQQLTSSESVLESIIQQEAVLSAPIGY